MRGKGIRLKGIIFSVCLSLVVLAMSLPVFAQNYPFREYTSDDGLPQLETMGVMQDSRGYIWMNTRNGLAQFDGHTFTSYYRKDGLPSNIVTRIVYLGGHLQCPGTFPGKHIS
jgi:ligand-binding sensor domain-containing protein